MGYMHGKNVVHRDLKLENIMVDDKLKLIIGDFGFATYENTNQLSSYKGTKAYMAPEIKERKIYDGKQTDMFSLGVILFIIVQCLFPFAEAKKEDYYYNLLLKADDENGLLDKYWEKTNGKNLSKEFKDLILKMINPNP